MYGVCLELDELEGVVPREGGTLVFFVANKDEIAAADEDITEIVGNPVQWLDERRAEFANHCATKPLSHDSFIAYT